MSPTEPRSLRAIGTVSSIPERYGSDFLFASKIGVCGVQRKEIGDLIASLHDGRFSKELGQMASLDLGVVVLEGVPQWSTDGYLLSVRSFTLAQWVGVLFSIQAEGLWLMQTASTSDTGLYVTNLEKWLSKDRHGIRTRPKAVGEWGTASNREWGIHLLQSFPGIGSDTAGRIYDHFKGVPLTWNCDKIEMQEVKGVGKGRAEKMIRSLHAEVNESEAPPL